MTSASRTLSRTLLGVTLVGLVGFAAAALAQHQGHDHGTTAPAATQAGAGSRKVTMEELHRSGGVPPGWKFALPGGDAVKGRQVFADLECYKCHTVKGESFPASGGDAKNVGPELTGMGNQHPAEYFAESILAPNAVILDGPGYIGPDGKSIMPSYADSLSVTQLVDLVAFIQSLTGGGHTHGAAPAEKSTEVYTVRLAYHGGDHAGHEGHAGHASHTAAAAAPGHLMVFVLDRATGEPVPYLPVSATIQTAGKPARRMALAPMVGGQGFHYGVDVTLPTGAHTITVTIGAIGVRTMSTVKGRFARPTTLVFERGS